MAAEHLAEDDLLDLVRGRQGLGEAPAVEAHLADCPSCSALLAALLAAEGGDAPAAASLVGRSLGPYRLEACIGAGAMGEVYRALDTRLGRHVAVKVLKAGAGDADAWARRLEAEGRAAAAITHVNVVTVHDVGADGGVRYVVSELIDGESLRSRIDRGVVGVAEALALGRQLARGLAAAHARGVIHRDLKPGNLLVTADGTLKILDFGLARLGGDAARTADGPAGPDGTEPGTVLGTMGYLAPEQARGEAADARSDVFAVGAILYEVTTGERAFGGASFAERLSALLRDTPERLADGSLGALAPVVARCLEKDPARRFQSAADLAWVLEGLAPEAPAAATLSRRRFVGVVGAVGAAALAGAAGASGFLLGRRRGGAGAPSAPDAFEQLTFRHGRVTSARFTRDGGSVVYAAQWDDAPVAVFCARPDGGGTRVLELGGPADLLAVSPRGELALSLDRHHVRGFHEAGRLALAPLEGGVPRVIADGVQDADFGPDGGAPAIVRRGGRGFRLEWPLGQVLVDEAGWLSQARVSPDGARVAFLLHPDPGDDRGDVVVVERRGGARKTLAAGFSSLAGLAWSAGGDALVFGASREGANNAVWRVSLGGRAQLVAATTGRLRVHDLAPDGRLALSHDDWRMRLMVRPPGAAGVETDLSISDISALGGLSADGSVVASGELGDVPTEAGTYVRGSAGGPAQRLGEGVPRDVSPDGRQVLSQRFGPGAPLVIYRVDGGERPVASAPIVDIAGARFLGADALLVAGAAAGRPPRVWRVSLRGAVGAQPLTDEGVAGVAHVSPDGARVAFVDAASRLRVLRVAGGGADAPVAVPGGFDEEEVCAWHEGGQAVFVRSRRVPIQVRRVELADGASAPHLTVEPPRAGRKGVDGFALAMDGVAYAYCYGQELSRLYTTATTARRRPGSSGG